MALLSKADFFIPKPFLLCVNQYLLQLSLFNGNMFLSLPIMLLNSKSITCIYILTSVVLSGHIQNFSTTEGERSLGWEGLHYQNTQPKSNFIPDLVLLRVLMTESERMVQQKAGPAVAVKSSSESSWYRTPLRCLLLSSRYNLQGSVPPLDSVYELWPWGKVNSPKSWFSHLCPSDSYLLQRAIVGWKRKNRSPYTGTWHTAEAQSLVAFLTYGKTDWDFFFYP